MERARIRIEPWMDADLDLLRRVNTPAMKKHVGGPETEERLLLRHRRYLDFVPAGLGCMYRVVLLPEGEPVGTVGYGTRTWQGQTVYEMGWNILPPYQGRGLAVAAARAAVAAARTDGRRRHLHAFPSVGNPASNAVCRRAGFTLLGETDFEFPPGTWMRSHDWRVDLTAPAAGPEDDAPQG
ncbi:GNAT family N-acetyltransferase [Kitasatospora sp. NPDC085879]|uniref:GNAT family N-acetyltransferase n=1 Tax=Kitasatospora sp. NPDC085879 TaxID=3154769 RepID=UPI0034479A86